MKHWRTLFLNEREGGKMAVKKDRGSNGFTIAAMFLMKRALNTDAIIRTFNPLWRSRNGFKIHKVGDHTMLFVFDNKR